MNSCTCSACCCRVVTRRSSCDRRQAGVPYSLLPPAPGSGPGGGSAACLRPVHRRFPLEAVLRLEQAAVLMQTAPGSSNIEILTALRDGLISARQSHRPAGPVPATPDALGPVLAELRVLRAELAELRALVITMQPVQVGEPLPTSPLPEQSPELHGRPQPSTSTVAVLAEPVPDQLEIQSLQPPGRNSGPTRPSCWSGYVQAASWFTGASNSQS